jgi:hypothetical protein
MTKIEELKKLQNAMKTSRDSVQKCLGNKEDKDNMCYVKDSRNDKHSFKFTTNNYQYSKPIYFNAYYGYYGDSSTSSFSNDFYMSCMTEAINSHIEQLINKADEIMQHRVSEALLEAKFEAEDIMRQIMELDL